MKDDPCEYCDGKVKPTSAQIDHWWKGNSIVIENVPVRICSQCGERNYDAAILRQLDLIAQGKVGSVRQMKIPVFDYRLVMAA